MKFLLAIVCIVAFFLIKKAHGSAIGSPFHPFKPEDLSEGDAKELEYLEGYYQRPKRQLSPATGSAGIIVQLKSAAIMGTKKKIVQLFAGSIGASARTSAGALANTVGGASSGVNMLKSALAAEATKKLGNIVRASAGLATGSIAAASKGGFGAVSGSADAVNQLKHAAFNTIGSIASGSARNLAQSSSGTVQGSASAIHQLKNAALSQIAKHIGQVVSGSARFVSSASQASLSVPTSLVSAGSSTVSNAAKGLHKLKQTAASQLINSIGQIASGSAKAITGASSSFNSKIEKVSGDFAVGGAEVANHLKTAIAAGTKQKLGQAASGLAGAITGAVGSASAGIGQITRGAFVESSNLLNQAKQAVVQETQRKFGNILGAAAGASAQLSSGSTAALQGSANGVHQLKSALLKSITNQIGQVAKGSTGAIGAASSQASQGASTAFSGSASTLHQLKSAFLSQVTKKIGNLARGSISAATGASGQASRGSGSILTGSAKGVHQLKSAAFSQIGNLARGSATAATAASGHASTGSQSALSGSASALHQIKSAALSHITNAIGQASKGTQSGISGSAQAIHQLKSAALTYLTNQIGQLSRGSSSAVAHTSSNTQSAVTGSAKAIHQIKSNIAKGISSASSNAVSSIGNGVTGSAMAILQFKKAAIEDLQKGVSLFAEASADASEGGLKFVIKKISHKPKSKRDISEEENYNGKNAEDNNFSNLRSRRSIDFQGYSGEPAMDHYADLHEVDKDLPKRSESEWQTGSGGSGDIIGSLKTAIVKGLKQKLVQVAKGSAGAVAGASAGFSKGSFGGDSKSYHHTYSYGPPHEEPPEEHKGIDVWDFKKSVLNTLLQAVKAIKGGVLAIKGQLIKGSGYVVAAGGKLIAASGDKVTKLGKNVINTAILVPPNKGHYTHEYASGYSSPGGPSSSGGHSISYDAPSSSGHGYESHYEQAHEKPSGGHAGILILRKMPTTTHDKYHSSHSHITENAVPPFKNLPAGGPTFGTVVGKFFTASTSLSPSAPSPFTDSDFHHQDASYSNHQVAEESHGFLRPPHPPLYEEPSIDPPISYQNQLIKEHKAPTTSNQDFSNFGGQYLPAEPPVNSYGFPAQQNDYVEQASNVNEEKVKWTKGEILDHFEGPPTIASSQVQIPNDAPESLQVLRGSRDTESRTLGPPLNAEIMNPNKDSTKQYSSGENYLRNALNFEKSNLRNPSSQEMFAPRPSDLLQNFLPHEDPPVSFMSSQELSNEISSKEKYMKFLENFPPRKSKPSYSFRPPGSVSYSSQKYKGESKSRRPPHSPNLSIAKSVSYQITPHGVKRLH